MTGGYDIIDRAVIDETGGWYYFYASPENGTQKYLYRVVRVIEDNSELRTKMPRMFPRPTEFVTIDLDEGVVMDAVLTKPSDFDASKKYPVFVYVYGEPYLQTVLDNWGAAQIDFHRVVADMGYLVYKVGIAVVPKPQPHLYNADFQEIYMRTPEVNPDGYQRSAPLNFAEGLQGKLLIITGSGETNTHVQIIEGLVDRLIELGKPFDYMVYPDRDHGLREGKGSVVHVRMLILRYLIENLPRGPMQ